MPTTSTKTKPVSRLAVLANEDSTSKATQTGTKTNRGRSVKTITKKNTAPKRNTSPKKNTTPKRQMTLRPRTQKANSTSANTSASADTDANGTVLSGIESLKKIGKNLTKYKIARLTKVALKVSKSKNAKSVIMAGLAFNTLGAVPGVAAVGTEYILRKRGFSLADAGTIVLGKATSIMSGMYSMIKETPEEESNTSEA